MSLLAGKTPWTGRLVAWGGALVFGTSLSYFLYAYAFTFGESQQRRAASTPGASPVAGIAWNVALFTIFAVHHSVFARERVRAEIARTVPTGLERSVYVWVAATLFLFVTALWQPVPGVAWSIPSLVGYAVMACGVWLTLRSAAVIDIWDLAGVRQAASHELPATSHELPATGPEFKTSGPYGYVRHPIYSAWLLMVFGVPVMTGTRLVFALVSSAYLLIGLTFEERSLRHTTAGAYDSYMQKVRWKLVPGVY